MVVHGRCRARLTTSQPSEPLAAPCKYVRDYHRGSHIHWCHAQVALDWIPNTNHTGFYIAKARGFYKDAGLQVNLLSPHVDGYKTTPATRVAEGMATFAICPSESVISYHTRPEDKPSVRIWSVCHSAGK